MVAHVKDSIADSVKLDIKYDNRFWKIISRVCRTLVIRLLQFFPRLELKQIFVNI